MYRVYSCAFVTEIYFILINLLLHQKENALRRQYTFCFFFFFFFFK